MGKVKYVVFTMLTMFPACSMFQRNEPSNEIVSLSDVVLKKHEGIDIQIKPIDLPYRK